MGRVDGGYLWRHVAEPSQQIAPGGNAAGTARGPAWRGFDQHLHRIAGGGAFSYTAALWIQCLINTRWRLPACTWLAGRAGLDSGRCLVYGHWWPRAKCSRLQQGSFWRPAWGVIFHVGDFAGLPDNDGGEPLAVIGYDSCRYPAMSPLARNLFKWHGWLTIAMIRFFPVGGNVLTNLFAGAAHIGVFSMVVGSFIGLFAANADIQLRWQR